LVEGAFLLKIGSFDGSRVFNVPMPRHRQPQPYETGFARRAVADGEHKIKLRCVRRGEFFRALRAKSLDWIAVGFECFQRERIDRALWMASGGIGIEASASMLAQDAFGEDRAALLPVQRNRTLNARSVMTPSRVSVSSRRQRQARRWPRARSRPRRFAEGIDLDVIAVDGAFAEGEEGFP